MSRGFKILFSSVQILSRVVGILFVILLFLSACGNNSPNRYQTSFIGAFDTVITIIGYADDEEEFSHHVHLLQERLFELHRLFDIFNEYEGLNNLYTVNQHAGIAPVAVSDEIIELLLLAKQGYELTGGVVNVALGPVTRLWHEERRGLWDASSLEFLTALQEAAQFTNIDDLIIDPDARTVFLRRTGMSLDVGAFAKTFSAALAWEETAGFVAGIINAGGNVIAVTPPLTGEYWRVGISGAGGTTAAVNRSAETMDLTTGTVAVSGIQYRGSHIIDPATLMPAERFSQVAVMHEEAWLADVLSTALFIMPYEEGAELARSLDAEAIWV